MKLAIMSDSHDRWDNLTSAVETANGEGCEVLLFAGDLIAPPGIPILEQFNGSVKFVWGNNEAERVGMTRKMDASKKLELCGDFFEGKLAGVRVFLNHYPRFSQLAAKSGEFDLCLYGHTHEYHEEKINNCLFLNPGEIQGGREEAGFVIYNTETKEATRFPINTQ